MIRASILAAGLIVGLLLLGLALGEEQISLSTILHALRTEDGGADSMIVRDIRLPRALLALLVGMALGVSGLIAQTVMQNPLAEPGLLGINAGAGLAALVVMVFLREGSPQLLAVSAFAGGMGLALAIYALSWRSGTSPIRIILIGIGLSALCGAAAGFISLFGDISAVQQAQVWLSGSFFLADWEKVRLMALVLLPALPLTLILARELDLIGFDGDIGAALGQNVQVWRAILLLLCVLLSATAVSVSGLIGLVGLIAPHLARATAGSRHSRRLPVTALSGGALLLAADIAGRTVIAPAQLPAGLVTALIGVPCFGWLMWKYRNALT